LQTCQTGRLRSALSAAALGTSATAFVVLAGLPIAGGLLLVVTGIQQTASLSVCVVNGSGPSPRPIVGAIAPMA